MWLTQPRSVSPYGNAAGAVVEVGRDVVVGTGVTSVADGPDDIREVDLRGVSPRVVENTADADVEMVLCTPRGRSGVGVVDGSDLDLDRYCSTAVPVRPGSVRLAMGGEEYTSLLVRIAPRQDGSVRIEGFDVTYRDGLRWGTQRSGIDVTVTTHPDDPTA